MAPTTSAPLLEPTRRLAPWDVFCSPTASARILSDLAEYVDFEATEASPAGTPIRSGRVVGVEGHVTVCEHRPAPNGTTHVARSGPVGPGHIYAPAAPCLMSVAATDDGGRFLEPDSLDFVDVYQVARALRRDVRHALGRRIPTEHCVCVAAADGIGAAAYAHLLAASVARQFDEPVAVVEVGDPSRARVSLYRGAAFVDGGYALGGIRVADVRRALGEEGFLHVFLTDGDSPFPLGADFDPLDRIVWVDDELPLAVPDRLESCLKPATRNETNRDDPRFSSFVTTVVPARSGRKRATPARYEVWPPTDGQRRRRRDACDLGLTVAVADACWTAWRGARRVSFRDAVLASRPPHAMSALAGELDRWARAATNRQVAVALSGGGASAYRFVPVLKRFAASDASGKPAVPVDIVSSVSGGSVLGAYYCADPSAGLDRMVNDRWAWQVALFGFPVRSMLIEQLVDCRVGTPLVSAVPVRFLPVALALPPGEPETRVMNGVTIGAAVRASGSLPFAFGPTAVGGDRYADGGFAVVIPAQVVLDYGADLVIAANCIAGPSLGQTLDESSIVHFLRRHTPCGRLLDLWISTAFLAEGAARLIGQVPYVHRLIMVRDTPAPFVELLLFADARGIIANAEHDDGYMEDVEACVQLWRDFRRWGDLGDVTNHDQTVEGGQHMATGTAAANGAAKDVNGTIDGLITDKQIAKLKSAGGYVRKDVIGLLENATPARYKVAQAYFSATIDTFYPLVSPSNRSENRPVLNIPDRQRCIIALQTGMGQTGPLAIHIYISLMEGISVDEIANIMLLAGVYNGVPRFFTGLEVLEDTIKVLADCADHDVIAPKQVLGALQAAFNIGPPTSIVGTHTPTPPAPPPAATTDTHPRIRSPF